MTAVVVNLRTGDKDAIAIGKLIDKSRGSIVDSITYLIEAGKKLHEKKETLAHGEWLPWLKENADVLGPFSARRMAQKLMHASAKYAASGVFG